MIAAMSLAKNSMVDLRYKLNRIQRWQPVIGLLEAIRFEWLWSLQLPSVSIAVPGYPQRFTLRKGGSDIAVFETVFVERELDVYLPQAPQLIMDGGANIGLTTAFYAHRYPQAKIVAIEPSSDNCDVLRKNCAAFDNVSIVEGGLWTNSGYLRLANPTAEAWGFQCEPAPAGSEGSFPAYSVDRLIDDSGVGVCDLMKLDIEGAEEQLFESASWLQRVNAILVEVHGEAADRAIKSACSEQDFEYSMLGEKLMITRKALLSVGR
jgi:FkbM family methyltransferase